MLKTLCRVSRRWRHIVKDNNILWSCLLLDEWHIRNLSEEQFINIMSHSSGFRYLSIRYIEMKTSERRLETLLGDSLGFSKHLRYLDLSGQPILSLNFLLTDSSPLETLILNDCQKLDTCCCIAILEQLKKSKNIISEQSRIHCQSSGNHYCLFMLIECSVPGWCKPCKKRHKADFAKIESPSVFRNILQFRR